MKRLWNRIHQSFFALAFAIILTRTARASDTPTFAERLGWPAGTVVLILHVDDVGMSHSSNMGAIEALKNGVGTSWSVMMPCPWVPEIAHFLKTHSQIDSGLHLTLTSEWDLYRWPPLAGKAQVSGLVDEEGCLWKNVEDVARHATPDEVEAEIRAQVDRAETLGLPITHLDSHMGTLFARTDYFERFLKVGAEKKIPILAAGGHLTYAIQENGDAAAKLRPLVPKIWNAGLPVIDDLHTGSYNWKPEQKQERFHTLLRELKPGITEILFHASLPTEDFPLITGSSKSRFADLMTLTDPETKRIIQEQGIVLTTWRELMARRQKAAPMK